MKVYQGFAVKIVYLSFIRLTAPQPVKKRISSRVGFVRSRKDRFWISLIVLAHPLVALYTVPHRAQAGSAFKNGKPLKIQQRTA